MRQVIFAIAVSGMLGVAAAVAQPVAPMAPAPLDDPWGDAFRKAPASEQARMLLARPVWDEDLRYAAHAILIDAPEGRDVLLSATSDPDACSRVASSVTQLRSTLKRDIAAGEHYWYEGTYTEAVFASLRSAGAAKGACAALITEIDALSADRATWAATARPAQRPPAVRVTTPSTPPSATNGALTTAGNSDACPPTQRALCDPETIAANRRLNEMVNGRPSAARDACYRALENDLRRTGGRVPNIRERAETCRRM
ncbi:MAG: hypothetical protein JNM47_17980 [Hyphomonadaceae bacterium]|nr:hypothetical protein [Hyphomonadaceae bacterium]